MTRRGPPSYGTGSDRADWNRRAGFDGTLLSPPPPPPPGTAPAASRAAPPERETITFSETFQDEFLTEACGVGTPPHY